jgi:hypothetical protein
MVERRSHRVVAALVIAFVAWGCGSGGNASGGGGGGSAESSFAKDVADAVCTSAGACCSTSFSAGDCKATWESSFDLARDAKKAGVSFDAGAAADCIAKWKATAAKCDVTAADIGAAMNACEAVYPGTVKPGGKCSTTSGVECESVAGSTRTCESGKCSPLPWVEIVGVGAACTRGSAPPPSGSPYAYCDSSKLEVCDKTGHCAAAVPVGGSCGTNDGAAACAQGESCDLNSHSCVAVKGAGDSCSDFTGCGAGLDCEHGVCQPIVGAGGHCASTFACFPADGVGSCFQGICLSGAQQSLWGDFCHGCCQ